MSEQPDNRVESVDGLRELYGDPSKLSQQKFMETVDLAGDSGFGEM